LHLLVGSGTGTQAAQAAEICSGDHCRLDLLAPVHRRGGGICSSLLSAQATSLGRTVARSSRPKTCSLTPVLPGWHGNVAAGGAVAPDLPPAHSRRLPSKPLAICRIRLGRREASPKKKKKEKKNMPRETLRGRFLKAFSAAKAAPAGTSAIHHGAVVTIAKGSGQSCFARFQCLRSAGQHLTVSSSARQHLASLRRHRARNFSRDVTMGPPS